MPLSVNTLLTGAAALVTVLALVLLAARILRASGIAGLRASARLSLHDSLMIDRTRSMRIVRCDGRDLLLLVGGGTDVVIGWLPGSGEGH